MATLPQSEAVPLCFPCLSCSVGGVSAVARVSMVSRLVGSTAFVCTILDAIATSFCRGYREPAPIDLDILLIMDDDFEVDQITAPARAVFDSVRAKLLFESDVFWLGLPGVNCSVFGSKPIKLPETFENAVLWNWSYDSKRRRDAARAGMRRQSA